MAVNGPPVAEDDSGSTPVDTPVSIPVLVNDADPEAQPIQVTGTTPPDNGSVTFTPAGELIYTPNPGFSGIDTLTYTIDDGNGGSDTATVAVTVGDAGTATHPPTAVADRNQAAAFPSRMKALHEHRNR